MRHNKSFPSIKAALDHAEQTRETVYVDVKQASEQLTGGLGPLSVIEIWQIKQSRRSDRFKEAARNGQTYRAVRTPSDMEIKIVR